MPIVPGPRETIPNLNTSVGITATILIPDPAGGTQFAGKKIYAATFQAKAQSICVAWDGADADTAALTLAANDILRVEGYKNLTQFKAINAGVSDATLLVIPEYRL